MAELSVARSSAEAQRAVHVIIQHWRQSRPDAVECRLCFLADDFFTGAVRLCSPGIVFLQDQQISNLKRVFESHGHDY